LKSKLDVDDYMCVVISQKQNKTTNGIFILTLLGGCPLNKSDLLNFSENTLSKFHCA